MNAVTALPNILCARLSVLLLVKLIFAAGRSGLWAAEPEVSVSLHVPPAETYVLGDDVPLLWRFTNRSTEPVAMLWEGCCRLNGRLTITASGRPVETLPPGAASFHSFSKAEQLRPGQPAEFASLLSDWVKLPAGGALSLSGRYTGVLTNQRPQVPANLALWTGTATSAPTGINLLAVTDYLAQREQRAQRRGIAVAVSGPATLPPLAPVALSVELRNLGATSQRIAWPGAFQLWIVDEQGQRLEKGTRYLEIPGEVIELAAGGDARRELRLTSADFESAKFGRFTLFLDLGAADRSQPRVPSSAISLDWRLEVEQVRQLLNDAGGGPAAGLRNPALRLLRQYLSAIQPTLTAVDDDSLGNDRARLLKQELKLAGCVQPLAPRPGAVVLPVGFNEDEQPFLMLSSTDCAKGLGSGAIEQVGAIAGVRRHLGWDVSIEVRPSSALKLGSVSRFASSLVPLRDQLAGPLIWRAPRASGGATNTIYFPHETPEANVIIKVGHQDGGVQLWAARQGSVREGGIDSKIPTTEGGRNRSDVSLAGPDALRAWLAAAGGRNIRSLVIADEAVECGELLTLIGPLLESAPQVPVITTRP